MIIQFQVSPELQQFLKGVGSPTTANVQWDTTFDASGLPTLPSNPATLKSIMFSMSGFTADATPLAEYNIYIQNIDGSSVQPVTTPRGVS